VDGLWSTFQIEIGTPPQVVRLLPGTSATAGDSIFVVLPEGCTDAYQSNCADSRGYLFATNASTTWSVERLSNSGLFELSLYEERFLGYSGNAYYGFDNVTLGLAGAGMPTLSHQLIAGIATPDFWLGSLGLSPLPFNFTTLNEPVPSLLGTLRREKQIPSTSWAYTAGAHYQDPPVFGSLTLGGYDSSRFVPNTDISIPFGADQSRDLVVGIHSITYNTVGSSPLLSSGIYAFINSMVSHLWLPIETCQAFERALNLTWNETAELYLIDDAVHENLVAQNPTFTFTVGPASKAGESVAIRLPYAAFDLNVSAPLVTSTSRYFPLKRAQNSSQYTLGRVFLQAAYIIADYDRSNFSIAQALFPSTLEPQSLVPILAPGDQAPTLPGASAPASGSHARLSPGVIAGIVIAAAIALICVMLVWMIVVRRQRRQHLTRRDPLSLPTLELSSHEKVMRELGAPRSKQVELPALAGAGGGEHELEDRTTGKGGDGKQHRVYELADSHMPAGGKGVRM
jgi:Eukaryotic aspartyl protease